MSIGTLYVLLRASRPYSILINQLGLDIEVANCENDQTFVRNFSLKKTPAFLGADGFKLTETIAILEYLVSLVPDAKLGGKSDKEKAQITRWLSFFHQDVYTAAANIRSISKTDEEVKSNTQYLIFLFKYIDSQLANQKYFVNDSHVTIADIYAYIGLERNLSLIKGVEFPNIARFLNEIVASNSVTAELSKE